MPFPGGNKPHAIWRPSPTATFKDKPTSSLLPFTNFSQKLPARSKTRRNLFLTFIGATVLLLLYIFRSPGDTINWRKRAIVTFATDQHTLCNAVLLFASLHAAKSKPNRVLIYPDSWDLSIAGPKDRTSQLLVKARDNMRVLLKPVGMFKHRRVNDEMNVASEADSVAFAKRLGDWAWWDVGAEGKWDSSVNLVKAWELDWYNRVLVLGGDVMVREEVAGGVDGIFDLNEVGSDGAVFAKEMGVRDFTDAAFITTPGAAAADQLRKLAGEVATAFENGTNRGSSIGHEVLRLGLLPNATLLARHGHVLSTSDLQQASTEQIRSSLSSPLVQFSDPPLPKPWVMWPNSLMMQVRPKCEIEPDTPRESGCEAREMWMALYDEYRRRRRDVCGLLSVPAPEWPPKEVKSN